MIARKIAVNINAVIVFFVIKEIHNPKDMEVAANNKMQTALHIKREISISPKKTTETGITKDSKRQRKKIKNAASHLEKIFIKIPTGNTCNNSSLECHAFIVNIGTNTMLIYGIKRKKYLTSVEPRPAIKN